MTKYEAIKACENLMEYATRAPACGLDPRAATEIRGILEDIRTTIQENCKEQ